jgi:hypothetical protein
MQTTTNSNKVTHSALYEALNNENFLKFKGTAIMDIKTEIIEENQKLKTNSFIKINNVRTLLIDENNIDATIKEHVEGTSFNGAINMTANKRFVLIDNMMYTSIENNPWEKEDIEEKGIKLEDVKNGLGLSHDDDNLFISSFDLLKNIKVSTITIDNKNYIQYDMNLMDIESKLFFDYLVGGIENLGFEKSDVKELNYKAIINQNNELVKQVSLISLEKKQNDIIRKQQIYRETNLDRTKVEVTVPKDYVPSSRVKN